MMQRLVCLHRSLRRTGVLRIGLLPLIRTNVVLSPRPKFSLGLGRRYFSSDRAKAAVKPGNVLVVDGQPHKVKKITQGKRGKGGGYVRAMLINLINGTNYEKTFLSDETVTFADLEKEPYQYSWNDGTTYSFLHNTTFEECQVPKDDIENADFLLEGQTVKLVKFREKVISVQLPQQSDYEVVRFIDDKETKTEKVAVLNSGAEIIVPKFIEVGSKIRVDLEERTFVGRAVN